MWNCYKIILVIKLSFLFAFNSNAYFVDSVVDKYSIPDSDSAVRPELTDKEMDEQEVKVIFGLNNILYPNRVMDLKVHICMKNNNGTYSYKINQYYKKEKIVNGSIVVHVNQNGDIYYIRGPRLGSLHEYIREEPSSDYMEMIKFSLKNLNILEIYYNKACKYYRLSEDDTISADSFYAKLKIENRIEQVEILISQETGKLVSASPRLIPALYRRIYDDDYSSTPPASPDRVENDPPVSQNEDDPIDLAYNSAELVYDYFDDTFNRQSYDDDDSSFDIEVNFRIGASPELNAYWDTSTENILVGDGDNFWVPEIICHEFGHGIAFDAGLFYTYTQPSPPFPLYYFDQNAALHESFGDCMAVYFDNEITDGIGVWTIGEDLDNVSSRTMADPDADGREEYYTSDLSLSKQPHSDGGIPSLAFWLAATGDNHPNSNLSTIDVGDCGIDVAADILYKSLMTYYYGYETFKLAAVDQTHAALNNYGYQEACNFASAWYAVGVEDAFFDWESDTTKITYMGWVYFYDQGMFTINNKWYLVDTYDDENGAMDIYSYDSGRYFWTSAEIFPTYYDYSNQTWDTFNGVYE